LEILGEKAWRPPLFRRLRSFHVSEVTSIASLTFAALGLGSA
jgi:hypothetical protein